MSPSNPQEQAPQPEMLPTSKLMLVLGLLLRIWRRIENIAFGCLILLLVLYFVLQSSWVQNWLIQRVAGYLSEELNTTVTVGHIDIAFFDNILLEQVYIADQRGDTLLYAGQLAAGVKGNFFSAIYRKLEFTDITLSRAKVYARRYEETYDFNYDFFIDYFSGPKSNKPKKPKPPFNVRVRNLRLNDVTVLQDNDVRGEMVRLYFPTASIQVNNLDMPSKVADFETVNLDGFRVEYAKRDKKPMPPRPKDATQDTTQKKPPAKPFTFKIKDFTWSNGVASVDNFRHSAQRTTPDGIIDFNHLHLDGVQISIAQLQLDTDLNGEAVLRQFTLREQCGFSLDQFSASRVAIDSNSMGLYGMELRTGQTVLGDTMALRYRSLEDFNDFEGKVALDVHLRPGTVVYPIDFAYFDKKLANNKSLQANKTQGIEISGQLKGRLNRLDGKGLDVRVGKALHAEFDFDGDDFVKNRDIARLMVEMQLLEANVPEMRRMLPGMKLPSQLEKLGAVRFAGSYNLLFGTNHVLKGNLRSGMGNGKLDMKLDLSGGKDKAAYSGTLGMSQFDLGTMLDNKELGKTSFNVKILPGSKGLTKSSMKANIKGVVDTLSFRGYTYRGLNIDGILSEALFKGDMGIKDPNIDFRFTGEVNLKDTIPIYVFRAVVNRLDLKRLNLSKDDLVFSANLDNVRLTGDNIADLSGVATLYNLKVVQDGSVTHEIDSLRFESNFQAQNFRHFALRSDFLVANIDGNFTLSKTPRHFLQLVAKGFPDFARQLQLPAYDSTEITDLYRFGLYIGNTKGFTKLLDKSLDTIRNVSIGGQVDGKNGISEMYANMPAIRWGSRTFENIVFNWRSERDRAFMKINLPRVELSKNFVVSSVNITANIRDNVANLRFLSEDAAGGVRDVDLNGALSVVDSLWELKIKENDSKFDLFGLNWNISKSNYIRFGRGYLDINELELRNGPLRRIALEGTSDKRGLNLILTNFDLAFINEILPKRGITYSGDLTDFEVQIEDVFQMKGISMGVATGPVMVNKQPYGVVDGTLSMIDLNHPLEWKIAAHTDTSRLTTTGGWNFGGKETLRAENTPAPLKPKQVYADVVSTNFPLSIIQQIVPGVSKVQGSFDLTNIVEGTIDGSRTDIGFDGSGKIKQGSFVVDYLNTPVYLSNQPITLTDDRIWADQDTIYDATHKNMAFVRGGLRHKRFSKWKIDCSVWSDNPNFVLMDTQRNPKDASQVYYGKGVGRFKADFSGTFSRYDIKIDATTGPGTKLHIPITAQAEAKEANFIKFKSKNTAQTPTTPLPAVPTPKVKQRLNPNDLKGLSVEMNLNMTEQAEVQIIFIEETGDIIKGWGNGNIAVVINREGDFTINGDYVFKRGDYLFTLTALAINKYFKIDEGSRITWDGDPYGAFIDITARYRENSALTNLLLEELSIIADANLAAEAAKSSTVDVKMFLRENLFKPTIGFALEFPNVAPSLKPYLDNKMRLLQSDTNQINLQVFGLIMFGTLLPTDDISQLPPDVTFNTATQFLSSQLSRFASKLATELLGSSVSNFDIAVDYQSNGSFLQGLGATDEDRDLLLRLSSSFADERITIQVGSQFGLGNSSTGSASNNSGFQGEDLVIEFQPTRNSQWKIKVFQRYEADFNINYSAGNRSTFGAGLVFSKEFNSVGELLRRKKS